MVEIGRGIARRAPHRVCGPPVEFRRARQILRQCQHGKRPAKGLDIHADKVQPRLDQRRNAVADLHRRQLFGRQIRKHRGIDMREPGVDHVDRAARKGEARDRQIDARSGSCQFERGRRPAVEPGMMRKFGGEQRTHFIKGRIGRNWIGHVTLHR